VIATGEQHSVREFVVRAAAELRMSIEWHGSGAGERGIDTITGRTIVEVDPHYYRPTEVDALLGDASKARDKLGWRPQASFDELVREMDRRGPHPRPTRRRRRARGIQDLQVP
jgi:GDPmannose 4,6-dehydratase